MQLITLLGFAAGTLTTLSFVPQVHKAWRTKRCGDLSLTMLLAFGAGVLLSGSGRDAGPRSLTARGHAG